MKNPAIPNAIKLQELKMIINGITQSYEQTLNDLQVMNSYAVKANDTGEKDRLFLNAQLEALKADIENKAQYLITIFGPERVNGVTIEVKLDSKNPDNVISIKYPAIDIEALSIKNIDISTKQGSDDAITRLNAAIEKVTLALAT